ncbi:hypothetical protein B296_00011031 [Ensete ventricosum]|uniref:Uncharacterized protein n=1 Tax=Ensete ventricosum TaxID=4639 RepID=A0A426XXS4_ENSVE|nr:hypothetical protein B296_00011031 [Ensete ventricosum]
MIALHLDDIELLHIISRRAPQSRCSKHESHIPTKMKVTRRRDSRAWPGHLQGGNRLQPRPPCKGATDCSQAHCKGRPPAGATAARGHDQLQPRPPYKGATGCGQAP